MKTIYLPSNLDLEGLLEANPPKFKYDLDKFKYLVGNMVSLKVRHKKTAEGKESSEFIPLNSTFLQERIRDYNHYLKYLVENGVFYTDNIYVPGQKSTGYKLADKYEEQEFTNVEVTNHILRRKRPREAKKESQLKKQYGHLTKWFNDNLHIDQNGAENYLKELLARDEKNLDKDAKKKYRLRQLSVDRIHRKDFDYNVDDTGRRFHSNLTNLKSGLRNFITYNGQQLCSIDVKNSQPFISTILFNREFYSKAKGSLNLYTLSPKYYSEIVSFLPELHTILSNISSPIMLVKSDESQASSDLELFCTLVDKGRLYPYLSQKFEERTGVQLNVNKPDEKKKLKDAIFLTLFSQNSFYNHPDAAMKRFFNELFPTVYRIFSLIKEDDHKRLPIILQLVESEIILKRVAKSINKDVPSLPIYTIHDSIITLADHKEMVRDVVKKEFHSALGLEPSLSFEMWAP